MKRSGLTSSTRPIGSSSVASSRAAPARSSHRSAPSDRRAGPRAEAYVVAREQVALAQASGNSTFMRGRWWHTPRRCRAPSASGPRRWPRPRARGGRRATRASGPPAGWWRWSGSRRVVLDRSHRRLVVGLGMIMTDEVERAVDREQGDLWVGVQPPSAAWRTAWSTSITMSPSGRQATTSSSARWECLPSTDHSCSGKARTSVGPRSPMWSKLRCVISSSPQSVQLDLDLIGSEQRAPSPRRRQLEEGVEGLDGVRLDRPVSRSWLIRWWKVTVQPSRVVLGAQARSRRCCSIGTLSGYWIRLWYMPSSCCTKASLISRCCGGSRRPRRAVLDRRVDDSVDHGSDRDLVLLRLSSNQTMPSTPSTTSRMAPQLCGIRSPGSSTCHAPPPLRRRPTPGAPCRRSSSSRSPWCRG